MSHETMEELEGLLPRVACLLQFRNPDGLWHARLTKHDHFGHGETPLEAVYDALYKRTADPAPAPAQVPKRRRALVLSDVPVPRRRSTQGGFFD